MRKLITRWRVAIALATVCAFCLLESRCRLSGIVLGMINREPFYKGQPLNYWVMEVGSLIDGWSEKPTGHFAILRRSDSFWWIKRRLGIEPSYIELTLDELPFAKDDVAALPVLCAMLQVEDKRVVGFAGNRLMRYGEKAAPAIPELIKIIREDKGDASAAAFTVLKFIKPTVAEQCTK